MGHAPKNPITFEERKQIEKHIKAGLSCCETSRRIGRSKNGVISEVRRTGRKFYSAKVAQNLADWARNEKHRKLLERNKGNVTTFRFKQRIENLEMQVEILHAAIKEILSK